MATVQKFQRTSLSSERRPTTVKPDMDKLFQAVVQSDDKSPAAAVEPTRDHDTACDILDRAASVFDLLTKRSQQLEEQLAESKSKLEAESGRLDAMTKNWERLAEGMRTHARECEKRLAEMTAKAESAEARAAELMIRAEAAELQFANLQNRSTRLHDKVVANFGIGSRAQALLDAIAAQAEPATGAAAVH